MKRFLLLTLILCAFGCNTTKKMVNRADTGFLQGDYIAASELYLTALQNKPNQVAVQNKLLESGRFALLQYFNRAQEAVQLNNMLQAATHFKTAQRLIEQAKIVGVQLPLTDAYAETQSFVYREMSIQLRAAAQEDLLYAKFNLAKNKYEAILGYDFSQQEQVVAEIDTVMWRWSEDLTQQALNAEADKDFKNALALFQQAQDKGLDAQKQVLGNDLFRVSMTWANVEAENKSYAEAIRLYQVAKRYALAEEQEEITKALFINHINLADVSAASGAFEQAIDLYESAKTFADVAEKQKITDLQHEAYQNWADLALEAKKYGEALTILRNNLNLVDGDLRNEVQEDMLQIMLKQALAAMDNGDFKAALAKAEEALVFMPRHPNALALRAEIIEKGTVKVVVLPMTVQGSVHSSVVSEWTKSVNEESELEYWNENPAWTAFLNPTEIKRGLRRDGLWEKYLQPTQARTFAQKMNANVVVMTEISGFELIDAKLDSTVTVVTNDKGIKANIVERRIKAIGKVQVAYQLLNVFDGAVLHRSNFEVRQETIFKRLELPLAISSTSPLLSTAQRQLLSGTAEENARKSLKEALQNAALNAWEEKVLGAMR